jgi:hypothetical protein
MVGEHLSMIFSARFNVDDKYLLDPERYLYKVVPFETPRHLSCRPSHPYSLVVEPIVRVNPEILGFSHQYPSSHMRFVMGANGEPTIPNVQNVP